MAFLHLLLELDCETLLSHRKANDQAISVNFTSNKAMRKSFSKFNVLSARTVNFEI
jgi:hypothetical protein